MRAEAGGAGLQRTTSLPLFFTMGYTSSFSSSSNSGYSTTTCVSCTACTCGQTTTAVSRGACVAGANRDTCKS